MITLSTSLKQLILNGYDLLKNHRADEFHQLMEKTKEELKGEQKYIPFLGLLSALQSEEYYNVHEYDQALDKIEDALKYDNRYLYLVFQAMLHEIMKKGQKTIPIYEEILVRDEERLSNLPEEVRYFVLNNLATRWFHLKGTPEWYRKKYGENANLDYAEEHYYKVLDAPIAVRENYRYLIANALNGIGHTMARKNKINESMNYFYQSMENKDKVIESHPEIVINSLNGFSWCNFQDENYPVSSHNLTKANRIAISNYGPESEISIKLAQNLASAWKERMGFEETGFGQVKVSNMDDKQQSQRIAKINSKASFYYNPNVSSAPTSGNNKAVKQEKRGDQIEISLDVVEDISQKILLIEPFLSSFSTKVLQQFGWVRSKPSSSSSSLKGKLLSNEFSQTDELGFNKGGRQRSNAPVPSAAAPKKLFSIL